MEETLGFRLMKDLEFFERKGPAQRGSPQKGNDERRDGGV